MKKEVKKVKARAIIRIFGNRVDLGIFSIGGSGLVPDLEELHSQFFDIAERVFVSHIDDISLEKIEDSLMEERLLHAIRSLLEDLSRYISHHNLSLRRIDMVIGEPFSSTEFSHFRFEENISFSEIEGFMKRSGREGSRIIDWHPYHFAINGHEIPEQDFFTSSTKEKEENGVERDIATYHVSLSESFYQFLSEELESNFPAVDRHIHARELLRFSLLHKKGKAKFHFLDIQGFYTDILSYDGREKSFLFSRLDSGLLEILKEIHRKTNLPFSMLRKLFRIDFLQLKDAEKEKIEKAIEESFHHYIEKLHLLFSEIYRKSEIYPDFVISSDCSVIEKKLAGKIRESDFSSALFPRAKDSLSTRSYQSFLKDFFPKEFSSLSKKVSYRYIPEIIAISHKDSLSISRKKYGKEKKKSK